MLGNYLKVGLRNISKYKVFSFINVLGLSLAMSVGLLIVLMLADQNEYDQFNAQKERIYRILSDDGNAPFPNATSPVPLASELKANYPIVEEATNLERGVGGDAIYGDKTAEMRGFFSNPSFFNVFSYKLEKGDKNTALLYPNSMVITDEVARKLFGAENPVGKTVSYFDRDLHYLGGNRREAAPTAWGNFTITGVIASGNYKSHMKFDVLVSSSSLANLHAGNRIKDLAQDWKNSYECFTYILVKEKVSDDQVNAMLAKVVKSRYAGLPDFRAFKLIAQRLIEITPGRVTGNPNSYALPLVGYYVLEFLFLIIIVLACFNYSSLSVSRALTRSKEIGVRKATGADRKSLIFQFLSESVMTVLFSLAVSVLMLFLIIPAFKDMWINTYLDFDFSINFWVIAMFIGIALVIGVAAGLYPAIYLSKLKPVSALKNNRGGAGNSWMKQALSISQFTVSLFFIATSILIFNQFRHFLEFDYRFTSKNIINVKLQGNDYQKIMQEFSAIPGVSSISACDILPSTGEGNGIGLRVLGTKADYRFFGTIQADTNFINNLNIKLIAGRNLSVSRVSPVNDVLLNEAALQELGYKYPAEIIGKVFESDNSGEKVHVVGVVRDFRFKLLYEQDLIGPLVLQNNKEFMHANIKISSDNQMQTIAGLEKKWKQIDPVHQFRYEFYEDQLKSANLAILDLVSILGFMALLAIVIACLGLLGMVVYSIERKAKEVGIRKVFGAGNLAVLMLLSKSFVKVIAISIFLGAPLTYFINKAWLEKIPNRVEFGWETIIVSTLILSVLGLTIIGSQTIKAALTNPLKSLRMD